MKIKNVKVGNSVYDITKENIEEHGFLGECRYNDQVIALSPTLRGLRLRETLTHEIVHAIFEEYEVLAGMTHVDEDDKEGIVSRVTVGLINVLVNNKELFKDLYKI